MPALLHTVRFRLDHWWAPRHMSGYLDGDMAASGERRLERHLKQCEECNRLLAGLRRMVETLHAAPATAAEVDPATLAASVRARLTDSP
jgi:anti-sigma factor RsiW